MKLARIIFFMYLYIFQTKGRKETGNSRKQIPLEDYKRLYDYLLANYTRHIRPLLDQKEQVKVNCFLQFQSILSYDVVNGVFSFSGDLEATWNDETLSWNTHDFKGIRRIRIPANLLWLPNIGIENSAEDGDFLNADSTGMYLLVDNGGVVSVKYSGIMKTTCTPDAYYYPFDVHTCSVVLVVFGYSKDEIHLDSLDIRQENNVLLRHAEWEVEIGDVFKNSGNLPTITVDIQLRRRSANIFLTTLLPLFMLVFLQVLVFVLPAESGERISYSITMFLSYAVFMTIVAENVPPSHPVTLISNFLTFLLAKGALILIVNILILNVHHRDESKKIPKLFRLIASCIFYKCRKMKNVVHPGDYPNELTRKESSLNVYDNENIQERPQSPASYHSSEEIQWPMVAHALDIFSFIIFISTIFIFITVFYFIHYF